VSIPDPASEQGLRRLAERRVAARYGFVVHAGVYLLVNLGLVAINLATSPHHLWFFWPALGWGLGLAAHAWAVLTALSGDHERAVQAEMERLRARGR
jgi:2TM domain